MINHIAVAGNLTADIIKRIDNFPGRGKLASILDISRGVGGCACNTSIALARLDSSLSVTALGRTGDDEYGQYIRGMLEREGIHSRIIIDPALPTSFTDVMSEKQGERTFFHARGANAAFGYDDIPYDKLGCDLFHIGYILLLDSMDAPDETYGTVMARSLARLRSLGIKTSVDVVTVISDRFAQLVTPSLKHCDYFIVNETEAGLITDLPVRDSDGCLPDENVRKILERLLDLGVHEIAAVHAPEGGWALSRSSGHVFVPSLALPPDFIKGHVGAGDAFCAGLLYGICRGFDLYKSLETAAGVAACNLSETNSTDGLRDIGHVQEIIGKWKKD